MKKLKPEPPEPMPAILIPEFEDWVANAKDDVDIASLVAVYESGTMGAQIHAGTFRLSGGQRAAVRDRAIALIRTDGRHEIEVEGVLWRTDGIRLWVELPCRDMPAAEYEPAEPFALEVRKVKPRRKR